MSFSLARVPLWAPATEVDDPPLLSSSGIDRIYLTFTCCLFFQGREVATGREIAIKKIKVGQFKDGLDMSAIREIKFLAELRHENVIEVRSSTRLIVASWLQQTERPSRDDQMLSVFSSKTNLNLVLEFLTTDLEYLIRNKTLIFLPGDVKSWMQMTLRGLEFCHRNGVLHRVRRSLDLAGGRDADVCELAHSRTLNFPGSETQQFAHRRERSAQDC